MTQARLVGNRYEIGELIGYGGMAEVHRGRDARLGREVAIKVLRSDLARDPAFLSRFRREAQSAAGLNHPAIVSVYDTGEDLTMEGGAATELPYIVMEYVEGRTLRDVLKTEGRLPARRAMEIVAEVCSALDFSHRNGIVHRDIKPANVMITRTGAVKVMDFGIARAVADSASTVTQTAAVIGTAQYLSPEQARGETVDARSDVYSCGCLLYELVTGHPPFNGDSPVAVAYQHVRENAPIPSSKNPEIPRALDSIVMKALAKNPLNRYQTAGEMRSDLLRALADRPVEAEAVLTDEEKTQFIRPIPAGGHQPPRPGPGYEPVADDGRRSGLIWLAVVVALLLVIGIGAYAIVLLNSKNKVQKLPIPSVINLAQADAVSRLTEAGFVPAANPQTISTSCGIDPVNSPTTVSEQHVCTQNPPANSQQPKGTTVSFTLFKKPTVTLQNYVGSTYTAAVSAITGQKLQVKRAPDQDNAKPEGTVLSQQPAASTPVAVGAVVTLTVSTGVLPVPNVIGQNAQIAKRNLNNAGWARVEINPTPQPVTDPKLNTAVVAIDPTPGSKFPPASVTITLTVGKYTPPPPTCPTTPPSTPSTATPTTGAPTSPLPPTTAPSTGTTPGTSPSGSGTKTC
jgi:eukaryotic-like serine/threonine-protein kinase